MPPIFLTTSAQRVEGRLICRRCRFRALRGPQQSRPDRIALPDLEPELRRLIVGDELESAMAGVDRNEPASRRPIAVP